MIDMDSGGSLENLRVWEFESRFNLHLAQKTRWFSSFFNSYDKEIASFRTRLGRFAMHSIVSWVRPDGSIGSALPLMFGNTLQDFISHKHSRQAL